MVENLQTCKKCGESASGPNKASVAAAMQRHEKKHKGKKR